jgi:hypothetical protein
VGTDPEAGNHTADRPYAPIPGMSAYTDRRVDGRPSLGTLEKGEAAPESLTKSSPITYG